MIDTARLEKLHAQLNALKIADTTRQNVLANLQNATEEQIIKIEKVIADATTQLAENETKKQKMIDTENLRYADTLREFRTKTIPQAYKKAEKEHQTKETLLLDELLQKAANL